MLNNYPEADRKYGDFMRQLAIYTLNGATIMILYLCIFLIIIVPEQEKYIGLFIRSILD